MNDLKETSTRKEARTIWNLDGDGGKSDQLKDADVNKARKK